MYPSSEKNDGVLSDQLTQQKKVEEFQVQSPFNLHCLNLTCILYFILNLNVYIEIRKFYPTYLQKLFLFPY